MVPIGDHLAVNCYGNTVALFRRVCRFAFGCLNRPSGLHFQARLEVWKGSLGLQSYGRLIFSDSFLRADRVYFFSFIAGHGSLAIAVAQVLVALLSFSPASDSVYGHERPLKLLQRLAPVRALYFYPGGSYFTKSAQEASYSNRL